MLFLFSWKHNFKYSTFRIGAGYGNSSTMQFCDFLCDGKPKAVALCGMGYICLIEFVKNMGECRRWDWLSSVRERNGQEFTAFPDDDVCRFLLPCG